MEEMRTNLAMESACSFSAFFNAAWYSSSFGFSGLTFLSAPSTTGGVWTLVSAIVLMGGKRDNSLWVCGNELEDFVLGFEQGDMYIRRTYVYRRRVEGEGNKDKLISCPFVNVGVISTEVIM